MYTYQPYICEWWKIFFNTFEVLKLYDEYELWVGNKQCPVTQRRCLYFYIAQSVQWLVTGLTEQDSFSGSDQGFCLYQQVRTACQTLPLSCVQSTYTYVISDFFLERLTLEAGTNNYQCNLRNAPEERISSYLPLD